MAQAGAKPATNNQREIEMEATVNIHPKAKDRAVFRPRADHSWIYLDSDHGEYALYTGCETHDRLPWLHSLLSAVEEAIAHETALSGEAADAS